MNADAPLPNIPREYLIKLLLEELPHLIKESDALKGAIISALSGVIATKEDINTLIRDMDRRFEALHKEIAENRAESDRRFEAMDVSSELNHQEKG